MESTLNCEAAVDLTQSKRQHSIGLEFWESEQTRPGCTRPINASPEYFQGGGQSHLKSCMEHPFLPVSQIQQQQLDRMIELVELAYRNIPVYRDKYQAAGFSPSELRCFDDIQKIPVITKAELIEAFPNRCLNPQFDTGDLFCTRSSGSSGETLLIRVDEAAILVDTIQGIRQFALQSGLKYQPHDMLAHVYTVPWWYDSVEGLYPSAFISNVIPPDRVARHLKEIAPRILSCYPSNLEALMPYAQQFSSGLYLAVTHSEYSSRLSRQAWAQQLGCPVLDEYSSEEATRIALEMPCGHYHVCDDAVHLDVLDPRTLKPQVPGESGLAVITNLLNTAMPFIRYVQGDFVTLPPTPEQCAMNWTQMASLDGRMNDAFINHLGRKVPAGSLLDVTYRWMFDRDLHLAQFELVQKKVDLVEARVVLGGLTQEGRVRSAISHLEELLSMCLEHPVGVMVEVLSSLPPSAKKRRPIRCEIEAT